MCKLSLFVSSLPGPPCSRPPPNPPQAEGGRAGIETQICVMQSQATPPGGASEHEDSLFLSKWCLLGTVSLPEAHFRQITCCCWVTSLQNSWSLDGDLHHFLRTEAQSSLCSSLPRKEMKGVAVIPKVRPLTKTTVVRRIQNPPRRPKDTHILMAGSCEHLLPYLAKGLCRCG